MKDFLVNPVDVLEIAKRQKKLILKSFLSTLALCALAFSVLPRSYQSETIFHVGVNYFQNPLIGNLISQTHDPGELRSEREKIIKSSIGVDFANKMNEKFHLFKSKPNDPAISTEIEWFLKSVLISPVTSTQFKIVYNARTPEVADGVVRGALAAIRENMFLQRIEKLQQLNSVLEAEIARASGDNISSPQPSRGSENQINLLIASLERRLEDLRRTYSDQHPSVTAIKSELAELQAAARNGLAPQLTTKTLSGNKSLSSLGMLTIRDDLNKQRHLVNIALEMEQKDPSMTNYLTLIKEPVFPKKPAFPKAKFFLVFSILAALITSAIAVSVSELYLLMPVNPKNLATKLNTNILGTISLGQNTQ